MKPVTSYEVAPMIGGHFFSSSQSLDAAPLFGVRGGYHSIGSSVVDSLGIEGTASYFTSGDKSGGKADGFILGADLIYSFFPRKAIVPFLALGGGGLFIDRNAEKDTSPFFNYGVGLKYYLKNSIALRFDARHLFVYEDVSTRSNFEITTGVSFSFGEEIRRIIPPPPPRTKPTNLPKAVPDLPVEEKPAPAQPQPAPQPPPPQAPEKVEPEPQAPTEPAAQPSVSGGAAVTGGAAGADTPAAFEAQGAPAAAAPKAPAPAVPSEAPAKGAVEAPRQKKLPAAPAPKKGQPAPKPVVPATETPAAAPAPAPPAELPAPAPEKAVRAGSVVQKDLTVEFDFGSAVVKKKYHKEIGSLAALIKGLPETTVRIEGHTDNIGSSAGNKDLSVKRAENVGKLFVKYGVRRDRITIEGYGFSRPKASNKTLKGRQQNRRAVVITIRIADGNAPAK